MGGQYLVNGEANKHENSGVGKAWNNVWDPKKFMNFIDDIPCQIFQEKRGRLTNIRMHFA